MKPSLHLSQDQALELGIIEEDQLWLKGQAYLGDSGRSYNDYLKDGGDPLNRKEAIKYGLCERDQLWRDGRALTLKEFFAAGNKDLILDNSKEGVGDIELEMPTSLKIPRDLKILSCDDLVLPTHLEVGGDLFIYGGDDVILPDTMIVRGNLHIELCDSNSLGKKIKVGKDLYLGELPISKYPDNIEVGGDFRFNGMHLEKLPRGLKIGGDLHSEGFEVPEDAQIGGYVIDEWTGLKYKWKDRHKANK
jgi:hypothetical protein